MSCVLTSLAYSEFASKIPVSGSAFTYVYVAFGEFFAWIVGKSGPFSFSLQLTNLSIPYLSLANLVCRIFSNSRLWFHGECHRSSLGSLFGCILGTAAT